MLVSVCAAYLLDLLLGDPVFALHPVRLIGGMLTGLERLLYPWRRRLLAGALLTAAAAVVVYVLVRLAVGAGAVLQVSFGGRGVPGPAGLQAILQAALAVRPVELVLVYFLFCNRDMAAEARAVHRSLASGDLEGARRRVGRIVGRDTGELDRRQVIRAAVESVAESLVDGLGAPLLYLVLGGAPLAYAYRAVNTVDSRFGYRNERYERFGKAGARLDDLLNFVPARLNGLFILVASGMDRRVWRSMRRFGGNHPSPNSGIAESGFAGALGMALGGASRYGGVTREKPVLGRDRLSGRELDDPALILRAVALYWRVTAVSLAFHAALLALLPLPLFGAPGG